MKSKLIILGVCLLVAGLLALQGWVDGKREIRFAVRLEREQLTADGRDELRVEVEVRNPDGKPRAGDTLQLVRLAGHGQLRVSRIKTDAEGKAGFTYYSYRATSFTPAMINRILISDVSVGKIVGVYKRHVIDIPVVEPAQSETGEETGSGGHIQLGGGS